MKSKNSSTLLTEYDKKVLEKYAGSQSVVAGAAPLKMKPGATSDKEKSGRQNTDVGNIH